MWEVGWETEGRRFWVPLLIFWTQPLCEIRRGICDAGACLPLLAREFSNGCLDMQSAVTELLPSPASAAALTEILSQGRKIWLCQPQGQAVLDGQPLEAQEQQRL